MLIQHLVLGRAPRENLLGQTAHNAVPVVIVLNRQPQLVAGHFGPHHSHNPVCTVQALQSTGDATGLRDLGKLLSGEVQPVDTVLDDDRACDGKTPPAAPQTVRPSPARPTTEARR